MAQQPSASIRQAARRIQQSFRRTKPDAARPDTSRTADSQPTTSGRSETFFLNCQTGETKPSSGCCQLRYTQASYQARDPVRDDTVLLVEKEYVVAAVLTALEEGTVARDYLKKNLSRELQRSRQQHPGDPEAALLALRENMLKHFRDKHPFAPSGSALDRVQAVLAFLDLSTGKLYLSGTGGARAVAASSQHEAGGIETLADVHLLDPRPRGRPGAVQLRGVTVTQLGRGRCRVILGSEGFWRDVPSEKAFLRLEYYDQSASMANEGNSAAHLLVYALNNITERTVRASDPRMKSLKSVAHLKSLQKGDISNYKWGGRQPVRRLAGDVHGDMTCIVLELSNTDAAACPLPGAPNAAVALTKPLSKVAVPASRARQRWGLVRMHFLEFSQASRNMTERRWNEVVQAALAQHRRQPQQEPFQS